MRLVLKLAARFAEDKVTSETGPLPELPRKAKKKAKARAKKKGARAQGQAGVAQRASAEGANAEGTAAEETDTVTATETVEETAEAVDFATFASPTPESVMIMDQGGKDAALDAGGAWAPLDTQTLESSSPRPLMACVLWSCGWPAGKAMVQSIANLLSGLGGGLGVSSEKAKALLFIIQYNAHRVIGSTGEVSR